MCACGLAAVVTVQVLLLTSTGRWFAKQQGEKVSTKSVAAVILGGGAGTRLYPLTKQRAKPAVPIGGAYRLIDVPMSNCINSGISKVYVLTQASCALGQASLRLCLDP